MMLAGMKRPNETAMMRSKEEVGSCDGCQPRLSGMYRVVDDTWKSSKVDMVWKGSSRFRAAALMGTVRSVRFYVDSE